MEDSEQINCYDFKPHPKELNIAGELEWQNALSPAQATLGIGD
jgi:hypothetical protein